MNMKLTKPKPEIIHETTKPVRDPQTSQRTKKNLSPQNGKQNGCTKEVEKSQIQFLIYFNSSRNRKFLFIKTNISQETKKIEKRK